MSDVKKTLFEAACEAEDGTRFRVEGTRTALWKDGNLTWEFIYGHDVPVSILRRTDFEQLPSGPKKRDVAETTWVAKAPYDRVNELAPVVDMMARLLQWEGAQIGKPGWVMVKNNERWFAYRTANDIYAVTFETEEQCLAAHKSECPEMFNNSI